MNSYLISSSSRRKKAWNWYFSHEK